MSLAMSIYVLANIPFQHRDYNAVASSQSVLPIIANSLRLHLRSCQLSSLFHHSTVLLSRLVFSASVSSRVPLIQPPISQVPTQPTQFLALRPFFPLMRFPTVHRLVLFGVFRLFCSVAAVPVMTTPQHPVPVLLPSPDKDERMVVHDRYTEAAFKDIYSCLEGHGHRSIKYGLEEGALGGLVEDWFIQELGLKFVHDLLVFDKEFQLPRHPRADTDNEQWMVRFVLELNVKERTGERTKKYRRVTKKFRGAVMHDESWRKVLYQTEAPTRGEVREKGKGKEEEEEKQEDEGFPYLAGIMLPFEVQEEISLSDLHTMAQRYEKVEEIDARTQTALERIEELVAAREPEERVGMVEAAAYPHPGADGGGTPEVIVREMFQEFQQAKFGNTKLLKFDANRHRYPIRTELTDPVQFELKILTDKKDYRWAVFYGAVWKDKQDGRYVWMLWTYSAQYQYRNDDITTREMKYLRTVHQWRASHNPKKLDEDFERLVY
ncbi:hypothetical protein EV361DRAFT_964988 [Lentinula raphanica]|nr:hypothetical protein EV361DRAFT_964988 [Lentinula raphanica]